MESTIFPGFYWWEHWYASCFPVSLRASALNYVSWILLIWMYYRMFSKKYPETMRRRAYVYGHKREGCPVLQRGQKCDQRFQNTQNLPLSALQTENPCPEREGKKSRSPVLPAAVNLSNGPDSCSFCMNLLKLQEICLCITEKSIILRNISKIFCQTVVPVFMD